ncbi:GNAT family N-acetyltransferase [Brucella haematophila]|uniref:GNAT family N-acetyltransferase n=1 Tax=Brucella haematophila TaxID=419474 RepID=UPI00110E9623|nr:GNAT family N-acetyltransferase [Brucella haematophila]TMV03499.1 GNAT family N-acetyltransferase [Brucella haematophila]
MICIRKAARIEGMGLRLRNAVVDDAQFIYSLRTNNILNRYISAVSDDVQQQIDFLTRYEKKDNEAFFVIEDLNGKSLGTIRLYDQKENSFCWGSWIVSPDASLRTGTKSALLLYIYAFEKLGFAASHFDVRQENQRVWKFHESWGAELTREDNLDRYYSLSRTAWGVVRKRYKSIIEKDGDVVVEYLS